MRLRIDMIDSIFHNWENWGLCFRSLHQIAGGKREHAEAVPAMMHWAELRDHLMQAQNEDAEFDQARFMATSRFVDSDYYELLPFGLWQWNRCSRRVFQLDPDLQALLRHTTIHPTISPTEVRFPFESFVMTLPVPIRGPAVPGGVAKEWRLLLVFPIPEHMSHDGLERLGIMLFTTAWETHRPFSAFDRDTIRKCVRSQNKLSSFQKVEAYRDRIGMPGEGMYWSEPWHFLVAAARDELPNLGGTVYPEIARILIGFALYLGMLTNSSPHRSGWEKPPKPPKPDPRSIIDGAEICTVASIHRLTSEERERFFSESVTTGKELSAHFRRGFFRRPPGKGDDPTAPKTIWVTPTLVRRDRLQTGELAGGAITIVK